MSQRRERRHRAKARAARRIRPYGSSPRSSGRSRVNTNTTAMTQA